MISASLVLYDADCGFCRWSLAKVLQLDRRQQLRPVAIQDPEAAALLSEMQEERRLASWHLVTPDGRVHSSGAAVAPLARMLPGGKPVARLAGAAPRLTERLYTWTAANRATFGRLLPRRSVTKADELIARRAAESSR